MSETLLIPIHVDALYAGANPGRLIAPLADFSNLPYRCWVTEQVNRRPEKISEPINSDNPFTSQIVMRPSAELANTNENYVDQTTGMQLHWSLPDALTVMRADPDSNNRLRFPQVPNRWLITSKTKSNNDWQIQSQWVVESDYLYGEQAEAGQGVTPQNAITFPIVPLDHYRSVLTNPPPDRPQKPGDVTGPYTAVYSAPFRYMGCASELAKWKNDANSSEYLYQFMPDGLTAVGYGDPLFAAIYTNCFSVFGFVDAGADNTQARRYDILGWYENTPDCLQFFASLAKQKPNANLYDALTSEYKWKVTNPPAAFPTLSVYYASVDVEAQLKPNPALAGPPSNPDGPPGYPGLKVAVGNTGTEALSADLAATLAPADATNRMIMEDQLEAIGLRHELADAGIDLDAKFREARHNKGFQPRTGGTLWSVQLRGTSNNAGQSTTPPRTEQSTLPSDLAQSLNELNLRQAEYDRAWQEIETLRHRVFADWHKFDNAFNFGTANTTVVYVDPDHVPQNERHADPTLDPTWKNLRACTFKTQDFIGDEDEILPYIRDGSLQQLQDRVAQAGLIEIGKDSAGKITFSAVSASDNPYVANQFTLGQGVLLQLRQLTSLLDQHNSSPQMHDAQHEFSMLRKTAPRFWQPNEPAVLLKGDVVPSTPRHGEDGRANDDDTLTCQVLSVATTLDAGGISSQLRAGDPHKVVQTIQSTIESLRPQTVTPNTIGFSQQTEEPWHPISLEWEVSVWPEIPGMDTQPNDAMAGTNYQPGFLGANYEFDEDASDLLMTHPPSKFTVGERENLYRGRTTLTPDAARQLRFNIAEYLMSLTLLDLKTAIAHNEVSDELDYQVDKSLIAWAQQHFTLTGVPTLKDPATITGPDKQKEIAQQQNAFVEWSRTQHGFRVAVTTKGQPAKYRLINLNDPQHFPDGWYNGKPVLSGSSLTTFGTLSPEAQAQDPLNTALRAYGILSSINVLAQSLGGFNNALLMRQQIPQLPVFDLDAMTAAIQDPRSGKPSDEKYKNLARDVAAAVAGGNNSSPMTDADFLPIRSGVMKVNRLYLVDTFGQVLDVSPTTIVPADTLTISRNVTSPKDITSEQDATFVYLAPRITQPARLNFRWLAADPGTLNSPDEPEMSDHPDTSPVCGWLIPNHLDNSLMFYDAKGVALGSILQTAVWEPAPGTVNRVRAGAIPNPHFRQLATYLTAFSQQHSSYWPHFLAALNYALENIEPASFAQHEALALLIGRPIAVVRASLGLQLQGKPALNQRWEALLYDMYEDQLDSRVSNEFTNVDFPVRLGEYKQFNDGLVGYWIEEGDGYQGDKFYSSQAEYVNDPNIITHHKMAITQNLTLTTAPSKLTMLVDPRGEVHATSAILPAKSISIPPDQYAGILRKLSVTFMTAPVLTEQGGMHLNLPKESGYSWSWLQRPSPAVWQQLDQIQGTDTTLKFSPQRLVGGWLKLTPEDKKP
jgi:hypothetical protein